MKANEDRETGVIVDAFTVEEIKAANERHDQRRHGYPSYWESAPPYLNEVETSTMSLTELDAIVIPWRAKRQEFQRSPLTS